MVIKQYDVFLISLSPTIHQIKRNRAYVFRQVISFGGRPMTTIEIVKELNSADAVSYRAVLGTKWRGEAAVHGELQAVGMTPGQALDALENLLAEEEQSSEEGMLVIVQRFQPDKFFNSAQQLRLRKLMDEFHAAIQEGKELSPEKMAELESLVEAEYQGAFARTEVILKEINK